MIADGLPTLSPAQLRELQRAIAEAAVDRLIGKLALPAAPDEPATPEGMD